MAVTTFNPEDEVPARAAAAIAGAIHVGSTTLASGRQVHHYEQQPLHTLLAQRNALVDAANALVDPPNEQLDDAAIGYETVERAIRETPAETVDDVVAKMALVAEFVRELGCPDLDDVEALLAEARSVLIRSCDPMHSEKVARSDAHWALVVPTEGRRSAVCPPEKLFQIAVVGRHMEPTYRAGEHHLVMRPTNRFEYDGIYALQLDAYSPPTPYRCQSVGKGDIAIIADNESFGSWTMSRSEFSNAVIGIATAEARILDRRHLIAAE